MYTRCPACHTVHPLNAALLTQGRGKYRCSKCNKVANALLSLFDEWPEPGQHPAPIGDIPVLGLNIDLEKAGRTRLEPQEARLTGDENAESPTKRRANPWLRALWVTAGLALVAVVVFKWAEFQGHPIQDQPAIQSALIRLGLREEPPREIYRELSLIHLVSRQLTSHPDRAGMLRLNATIVNRASRPQPFPDLEVVLLDSAGEPVATHRYAPRDYLAPGARVQAGMAPQAYLPLSLDIEDPGRRAVGFELNFH